MAATELPVDFNQIRTMFDGFIHEVDEDFQSPGISHFQTIMPKAKKNVLSLEQSLHADKKTVMGLRDSLKELTSVGDEYQNKLFGFAEELKRYGQQMVDFVKCLVLFGLPTSQHLKVIIFAVVCLVEHFYSASSIIGSLFITYGLIVQQVSALNGDMANSMKNVLLASLNLVIDTDLHGNKYKSYVDKNVAVYESAKHRVEREERAKLRSAGQPWKDKPFQPEELAGQLVEDRRRFQLRVVDYMVKVVDVKSKRGVDFAEHLQGYSKSMKKYFEEGSKLMDLFKGWNEKTEATVQQHRTELEDCRKKLRESQERLKNHFKDGGDVVQRHKAQTATFSDITEKSGYLLKKPDHILNLNIKFARRAWQKKYCSTNMMGFTMANSHTHPPSLAVPPLNFKCNDIGEQDGHKFCFELFTPQRTYVFAAETEAELKEWKATMDNCMAKFISGGSRTEHTRVSRRRSGIGTTTKQQRRELVKRIVEKIKQLPGNQSCVDCGSKDPVWLSVNLGVLMCLQCSGIHRNLSVQVSRIRSLDLDDLQTFELLVAYSMANQLFNEVMEANLVDPKPTKQTDAEERAQFIRNKYVQRKYIDRSDTVDSLELLYEAMDVRDFRALLQAYAEGVDITQPLPNREDKYTALHLAVEQEDLTSLHIVEFISTNSRAVNTADSGGNTALHIAAQQGMLECMKILLRNGANVEAENDAQQTPLSLLEEEDQFSDCLELLKDAQKKKLHVCDNVNIDWGVDEDDEIYQIPEVLRNPDLSSGKMIRTRPISTYNQPSLVTASHLALKRTKSASPETTIGEEKEEQIEEEKQKDEQQQQQQENKQSAPLPPTRSQSQDAIPINKVSPLVPPKRKQKLSSTDGTIRNSVAPSVDVPDGSSSPQIPPKPPQILYRVEALYDCTPDNKDELAFQEGDKIAITKEHGNDWLRGYVFGNPNQKGLIPFNYVKRISIDSL